MNLADNERAAIATIIFGAYPEATPTLADRCVEIGLSPRQVSGIVAYGLPRDVLDYVISLNDDSEKAMELAAIEADEMRHDASRPEPDCWGDEEDYEDKIEREAIAYWEDAGITRVAHDLREIEETILAAYPDRHVIVEKCTRTVLKPQHVRELVSLGLPETTLEVILSDDALALSPVRLLDAAEDACVPGSLVP